MQSIGRRNHGNPIEGTKGENVGGTAESAAPATHTCQTNRPPHERATTPPTHARVHAYRGKLTDEQQATLTYFFIFHRVANYRNSIEGTKGEVCAAATPPLPNSRQSDALKMTSTCL